MKDQRLDVLLANLGAVDIGLLFQPGGCKFVREYNPGCFRCLYPMLPYFETKCKGNIRLCELS
jgi:hypothetical protein